MRVYESERGNRFWYGTGSTKNFLIMCETEDCNYRVYKIWLLQILLEAISRHIKFKELTENRQLRFTMVNYASL